MTVQHFGPGGEGEEVDPNDPQQQYPWSINVIHHSIPTMSLEGATSTNNVNKQVGVVVAAIANPPWYCIVTSSSSSTTTATTSSNNNYQVQLYYHHTCITALSSAVQNSPNKRPKRTHTYEYGSNTTPSKPMAQDDTTIVAGTTTNEMDDATYIQEWYSCTLELPDLTSSSSPPLLGMLVTNNNQKCMLYIIPTVNTINGEYNDSLQQQPSQSNVLFYYKVSTEQMILLKHSESHQTVRCVASVHIGSDTDIGNNVSSLLVESMQPKSPITSTNNSPTTIATTPVIIVGTTNGTIYKIQQITVPFSLQCITVYNPTQQSSIKQSTSLFQRLNFLASTTSSDSTKVQGTSSAIVSIHLLQQQSISTFMTITKVGMIQIWRPISSPTSSSNNNNTINYNHQRWDIHQQLSMYDDIFHSSLFLTMKDVISMEVLRSSVIEDCTTSGSKNTIILHCIVRIKDPSYNNIDTNYNTTNNDNDDHRLFWMSIVLQQQQQQSLLSSVATTYDVPRDCVKMTWLNRFAYPMNVSLLDMCTANDHIVYCIFTEHAKPDTTSTSTTVVMACNNGNDTTIANHHIAEIDVPITSASSAITIPIRKFQSKTDQHQQQKMVKMTSIVSNSTSSEKVVSYGINLFDMYGSFIRIRYNNTMLEGGSSTNEQTESNSQTIQTLTSHLHSTFRSMLKLHNDKTSNMITIELPPSIKYANKYDIEVAVEVCAIDLYNVTTKSNDTRIDFYMYQSYNPLDIHVAYVTMLQRSGIYRTLSLLCKWKLLCIGQRISIWLALHDLVIQSPATVSEWEINWFNQFRASNSTIESIDEWISDVQKDVFNEIGNNGGDRYQIYLSWFVMALSSAALYREERTATLYDLSPNQLPIVEQLDQVPLWTTKPTIRRLLHHIVKYWEANSSTFGATIFDIEFIIEQYVLSHSDTNISYPSIETKTSYVLANRVSCHVIRGICNRSTPYNDTFIFGLCIKHRFFREICQIVYDHEHRRDRHNYSLEELFQTLSLKEDIETGMAFSLYVLKWHTDRKYYGHVMKYGKLCPQELNQLINNDKSLQPYRWMHDVNQGDYNNATDSSFSASNVPTMCLKSVATSLRIASMSSKIFEEESISPSARELASQRRRLIDKKLELINVQKQLMNDYPSDNDFTKVWTADQLLHLTIQIAQEQSDIDKKVSVLELGVSVCTTLIDIKEIQECALVLWMNVIALDIDFWNEHVHGQSDILFKSLYSVVRKMTVFGKLLTEVEGVEGWKDVSYTSLNYDEIMLRMGDMYSQLLDNGLHRLLRITASSA